MVNYVCVHIRFCSRVHNYPQIGPTHIRLPLQKMTFKFLRIFIARKLKDLKMLLSTMIRQIYCPQNKDLFWFSQGQARGQKHPSKYQDQLKN